MRYCERWEYNVYSGLKLPSVSRRTKESLTILKKVQGYSRRDIVGHHLVS